MCGFMECIRIRRLEEARRGFRHARCHGQVSVSREVCDAGSTYSPSLGCRHVRCSDCSERVHVRNCRNISAGAQHTRTAGPNGTSFQPGQVSFTRQWFEVIFVRVREPASTPGGSRGSGGCGRINGAVCCRDAAGREAGGRCTRLGVRRGGHSVHAALLWRLSSNRWNNARPSDAESP